MQYATVFLLIFKLDFSLLVTKRFTETGQQLLYPQSINIHVCKWTLMCPKLLFVLLTQVDSPWRRSAHRRSPPPDVAYISLELEAETQRTAKHFQKVSCCPFSLELMHWKWYLACLVKKKSNYKFNLDINWTVALRPPLTLVKLWLLCYKYAYEVVLLLHQSVISSMHWSGAESNGRG